MVRAGFSLVSFSCCLILDFFKQSFIGKSNVIGCGEISFDNCDYHKLFYDI